MYGQLTAEGVRLFTNNYVVDETATRLRYDLGLGSAVRFHDALVRAEGRGSLRVLWVHQRAEQEAWSTLELFESVRLSLTDATVAVSAREARTDRIFTVDRNFSALNLTVLLA